MQYKSKGRIDGVLPGSPAAVAGIIPGDQLVAINGKQIKDVVGYQFNQVGSQLSLSVSRGGEMLVFDLNKDEDQDLGLEFYDPTFDGIKRCNNRCPFCFIDQNAPGLRTTLDIKDDDYRYSFLYGGFITLTNFKEADWQRIDEERLTPLYVSVHATDPALRRRVLGNPRAPEIIPQLQRLADMGIQTHTQLVLVPGVNDGAVMERSIRELAELYPAVQSVSAVPVGLTRHRRKILDPDLRSYTREEMKATLAHIERIQQEYRAKLGNNFVYASDEFYILAGEPIPSTRKYDGFQQYENGVGMVRKLYDEAKMTAKRLPVALDRPVRAVIVCGTLAGEALKEAFAPFNAVKNLELEVVVVDNIQLGPQVSCSGLLFGKDVVEALKPYSSAHGSARPADVIFLPRRMFDFAGTRTLDEWTFPSFQEELGCPVVAAEWTREVLTTIRNVVAGRDVHTQVQEIAWVSALG